jgi:hypothetical protein
MQNKQQNYNLVLWTAFFGLMVVSQAWAGGSVAERQPLLHDGGPGPCDPGLEGPDVVEGVDVGGHPVTPVGPRAYVPVPDQILVPLKNGARHRHAGEAPLVALDGKTLDPLLNPPPACPQGKR